MSRKCKARYPPQSWACCPGKPVIVVISPSSVPFLFSESPASSSTSPLIFPSICLFPIYTVLAQLSPRLRQTHSDIDMSGKINLDAGVDDQPRVTHQQDSTWVDDKSNSSSNMELQSEVQPRRSVSTQPQEFEPVQDVLRRSTWRGEAAYGVDSENSLRQDITRLSESMNLGHLFETRESLELSIDDPSDRDSSSTPPGEISLYTTPLCPGFDTNGVRSRKLPQQGRERSQRARCLHAVSGGGC